MAKRLSFTLNMDDMSDEQILGQIVYHFENVFLKRGGEGVLACGRGDGGESIKQGFPPKVIVKECVSVTGAGDRYC